MSADLDAPILTKNYPEGTISVRWPVPQRPTYECTHEVVQMFVDDHNGLVENLRIANERADGFRRLVAEDTLRIERLTEALRAFVEAEQVHRYPAETCSLCVARESARALLPSHQGTETGGKR